MHWCVFGMGLKSALMFLLINMQEKEKDILDSVQNFIVNVSV